MTQFATNPIMPGFYPDPSICAVGEDYYLVNSPCPNQSKPRTFAECMERPAFITNEQIGDYIDRGFCNFKIAGRGMPSDYVEESYLYFLVKDEHRAFIKEKIDGLLAQFKAAQQGLVQKKNI